MSYPAPALAAPQIRNILLATDFSPASDTAAPYARAIARLYGATIHVLHVLPEALIGPMGIPLPDTEAEESLAWEHMRRFTAADAFKEVAFTPLLEHGYPPDTLLLVASELRIDLIVLGTHGRKGMTHFLLGSIAEEVFRRARCPVLTVGPQVSESGLVKGSLDCILYATDFSPASMHALGFARSLARTNCSRLVLYHAVQSQVEVITDYVDQMIADARRRLQNLLPDDRDGNYEVVVDCGAAADGILQLAKEKRANLIVMGAHRGAAPASHSPWAVTHQVVRRAECPVFTVRA